MENQENKKSWWASKTLIVNALTGVAGILMALTQDNALDPQTVGVLTTILAAVNVILRLVTNQPVGK